MARPVKHNLEYFPLDVSFFDNHKVILIEEELGIKGGYLAIRLMAMVYEKGYYLEWKERNELSCAKRVGNGYTGALVLEVLKCCLRHGLFSKDMFDKYRILTSKGIQERWLKVMKGLRRTVEVEQEFWLVSSEETAISSEETPPQPEETPASAAESTQKEIKGNESKEDTDREESTKKDLAPAKPSRKKGDTEDFKQTTKHWQPLVDVWFSFNKEKFGDNPSFKGQDPKNFKKIVDLLEQRAKMKNVEWTEEAATHRLKEFLKMAYKDEWLRGNFLLHNLEKQFDKFKLNQNGSHQQTPAVKPAGKSAGANQLLGMLQSDLHAISGGTQGS